MKYIILYFIVGVIFIFLAIVISSIIEAFSNICKKYYFSSDDYWYHKYLNIKEKNPNKYYKRISNAIKKYTFGKEIKNFEKKMIVDGMHEYYDELHNYDYEAWNKMLSKYNLTNEDDIIKCFYSS